MNTICKWPWGHHQHRVLRSPDALHLTCNNIIHDIACLVYGLCIFCYSSTNSPWSAKTHPVHVTTFVEPVGPSKILPPTILGIFKLFFTTALIGYIVEQTNKYAHQVLGEAGDQWEEVNADMGIPRFQHNDGDK